ncbi:MAG: nicotinamidase [Chloroflexi bacterium]|nr:nicotinamidase [Chloroflexota bacterium]
MATDAALLIVDVQNDFCPGGALAVPEGDRVVPALNAYVARFQAAGLPIFASRDWHPPVTKHFKEHGGLWPPHCVQGTRGAEFHPDLRLPEGVIIITKGDAPDADAYSPFEGHTPDGRAFPDVIRERGVGHLYVGGLATDYCVRASVLDARKAGLRVTLLEDAARGVDVQPGDSERAVQEMVAAGAERARLDSAAIGPAPGRA